ncbi:hypothetical protein A3A48_02580 [Candidatus Curtissbacteria bacterium RIFCSPLOWO2_01_FULL_37_9]|uniref:Glycosyltransferase RgtA/B/C/D-like domain-containing protein n=1 Tax=Candidatus Curtissbacteria bacterium RIFCSPLOWO2_01_FULL_37_9 TaxID=1797724 RepID=A0A1F5GQU7_9BACT|nr:MAG: hypothetical protein A3A48_02580 [Candidatus Curtissbacteria bacterium RIFCSPLOWO2_01_FULL_37_9]
MTFFRKHKAEIFVFLITFIVYFIFSNQKPSIYNHHVYIANAFLHGTFEIQNSPSWHNDVAVVDGKIYGIYGPMPAILLLPLVAIFGLQAPEGFMNLIIATSGVVIFWRILSKMEFNEKFKLWLTSFYAFGTLQFFSAAHDQTWWYTYIVASFLILLSINELLGKKRPYLVGLFIGAAYATRVETVFVLIFALILINLPKAYLMKSIILFLGFSLPFILVSYYNFARFGNIFKTGYENFVTNDPSSYIPYGLFSWNYLPNNFYTYFLKGPEILANFPYLRPPWIGMSIIFTTPVFLFALNTLRKRQLDAATIGAWFSVILMAIPSLIYFLPGWTEFGWKHSVVFTPFLVYLTARGMGGKLNLLKKGLILFSISVQIWGVLWWKLAGWFY